MEERVLFLRAGRQAGRQVLPPHHTQFCSDSVDLHRRYGRVAAGGGELLPLPLFSRSLSPAEAIFHSYAVFKGKQTTSQSKTIVFFFSTLASARTHTHKTHLITTFGINSPSRPLNRTSICRADCKYISLLPPCFLS